MDALIERISRESGLIALVALTVVAVGLPILIWRVRAGESALPAAWRTGLEVAILGAVAGIGTLTLGAFATGGPGPANLVSFQSLFDAMSLGEFWVGLVMVDLMGNFLLYHPLGLLVGLRFQRLPVWVWVPLVFALTATVEIVQGVVLDRSADITDVLMNGLGGSVGFLAARVIPLIARSVRRKTPPGGTNE